MTLYRLQVESNRDIEHVFALLVFVKLVCALVVEDHVGDFELLSQQRQPIRRQILLIILYVILLTTWRHLDENGVRIVFYIGQHFKHKVFLIMSDGYVHERVIVLVGGHQRGTELEEHLDDVDVAAVCS